MPLTRKYHHGFSLVELLVSLVIGLIILLALYVVLMGSISSVSTSEAQGALVDNGRRSSNFIRKMLQQAGYRPLDRTTMGFGFEPHSDWATLYQVTNGVDGGATASDQLQVRFWGAENGLVTDCSGEPIAINQFAIVTIDVLHNQLRCTHEINGVTVTQIVSDNIESLQVRFSLIESNDYIRALSAGDDRWERVNRVEFAILTKSSELSAGGTTNSNNYQVLDTEITAPGDRFLRAVYQESVWVRNLIISGRP